MITKQHHNVAFYHAINQDCLSKGTFGTRNGGIHKNPTNQSGISPNAYAVTPKTFGTSRINVNNKHNANMNSSNTGGSNNDYIQGYVSSSGRIANSNLIS